MATTTTQISQSSNNEINRQEIQAAIAKAVELRALHAALMQGNSPANPRFLSSSPVSRPPSQFSAHDYPVFTPSYDDELSQGYHQSQMKSGTITETWEEYEQEELNCVETVQSDRNMNSSLVKGFPPHLISSEPHIRTSNEDHKSISGASATQITVIQTSSTSDYFKSSRKNSAREFKSKSLSESENPIKNSKTSNIVVPLTDSHSSVRSQQKNRGQILSWLFPRLKKKSKNENSPNRTESEDFSQPFRDLGVMSIETIKKQLIEANESRDAALMEVSEMKSSLGELKQKLEYLESYCEDLKKALRQAAQAKESQLVENSGNLAKRGKSIDEKRESLMPVSKEVMVEGFLQIVSESRLSVKQFCKTLIVHVEESDNNLTENLNSLLEPYKLSLNSKYSKAVLYHLEAIINQTLYQDFENCAFQKNGSPKFLDPHQDRQAQFSSFVALRNLSWNEVLRKGTKYYSEEFSKFCDQKMSFIISTLNWTRPWPEVLLQSFFVTAKCIWLLHLLAFSFDPPLTILRVEENRSFDGHYMEDIFAERQRVQGPNRVKIMVMPGFYVQDRVLRCKVLCRYKSVS